MLIPDANTQQGLAQTSPAVRLMLTNELMTALDHLMEAQEPAIFHQLQGRARCLKELLNAIEQAEKPATLRQPTRHTANATVR